jgi:hypothetical protein
MDPDFSTLSLPARSMRFSLLLVTSGSLSGPRERERERERKREREGEREGERERERERWIEREKIQFTVGYVRILI